jgi:hypothetical protein
MKLYIKIIAIILYAIGIFGMLLPYLLSADSNILVLSGVGVIILSPIIIIKLIKY